MAQPVVVALVCSTLVFIHFDPLRLILATTMVEDILLLKKVFNSVIFSNKLYQFFITQDQIKRESGQKEL